MKRQETAAAMTNRLATGSTAMANAVDQAAAQVQTGNGGGARAARAPPRTLPNEPCRGCNDPNEAADWPPVVL